MTHHRVAQGVRIALALILYGCGSPSERQLTVGGLGDAGAIGAAGTTGDAVPSCTGGASGAGTTGASGTTGTGGTAGNAGATGASGTAGVGGTTGGAGATGTASRGPVSVCEDLDWSSCLQRDYLINDQADADDLRPYSCVKGKLEINAPDLTSLALPNLKVVGGPLRVTAGVSNLDGLAALTCAGGNVEIVNSPKLEVADLPSLVSIQGSLRLQGNGSLREIRGFTKLVNVITGIELMTNSSLAVLDAFGQLEGLGESLVVSNNPKLGSLQGFDVLKKIGGQLFVDDGPDIWPTPTTRGGLFLSGDALADLPGLKQVQVIGGTLSISGTALPDLDDLGSLREIGGDLRINTPLVINVRGLGGLTRVGGGVSFSGNKALVSLAGLTSLRSVGSDLGSCCGLIAVGDFVIVQNDALEDVGDFLAFRSINVRLTVTSNPLLAHLDGFAHLNNIGWEVTIQNNARLSSVKGLAGLTALRRSITVRDNPTLSQCDVCAFRHQFINYTGTFTASGNGPDACALDCSGGGL